MKALMLIVFSSLYLISCKKEAANDLQSNLVGKWELRRTDGGYAAQHILYPMDNGNTFIFYDNNHYARTDIFDGDISNINGVYTIIKGDTCHGNDVTIIKFSDNDIGNILLLSDDTFTIRLNGCVVADDISYEYERIK